ncbi:hypothetical protein PR048_017481 [Dryococelus australis]|uniref:Uncharacterized protein n=1 Tax=Dryococelus australis TaxID=614101 RepID=A0ABQ9H9L5_9NEOP|nr:hypothetical protein PR048_017481 [Dryococelus australis]
MPDDAAGRWVFSVISRFLRSCIPALLHIHLASPSSALETSIYALIRYLPRDGTKKARARNEFAARSRKADSFKCLVFSSRHKLTRADVDGKRNIAGAVGDENVKSKFNPLAQLLNCSRGVGSYGYFVNPSRGEIDSKHLFLSPMVAGATVAERLARSPPTKTNRIQSPAGSPDFRKWESMPLVGGFSGGSPVSPVPSFRSCSILTSIPLIGSQDLAV